MRKSAVAISILAMIAGVIGCLLRLTEIRYGFEEVTGFARSNYSVTVTLAVLSVIVIIGAVIVGVVLTGRMKAVDEFTRAFAPKSVLYIVTSLVLGCVWLIADILHYLQLNKSGALTVLDAIFLLLSLLSALSLIVVAMGAYKGKSGGGLLLLSMVPSLFYCFWLIVLYKNNASNPVVLQYSYESLAIAAAALSSYFVAGFVFKKAVTGKTIFSFIVTIFFCTLVLADSVSLPTKMIFGVTALNTFINTVVFLRNMVTKRRVIED